MRVVMQYRQQGFVSDLEQAMRACFAHITNKIRIVSVAENPQSKASSSFSHYNSNDKEIYLDFDLQADTELEAAKKAIQEAISLRGYLTFMRFENMPTFSMHSYSHLKTNEYPKSNEKDSKQENYCGMNKGFLFK